MFCSQCGQQNADTATVCQSCQQTLYRINQAGFDELQYSSNSMGGLIPYRNVPALISYYCGLFSILPLLGSVLVVVGLVAGYKGLRKAKEHPELKGKAHAWVGLIASSIGLLFNGLLITGLIIAFLHRN